MRDPISEVRRSYRVTGRVQGVAFRAHTVREAERLGLVGFVVNRPDGAVSGEVQGPAPAVERFLAWLWTGSPWSAVAAVTGEECQPVSGDSGFVVRR